MATAVPNSTYTNALPAGQTLTVVTTGTALIERKSPAITGVEKTPVAAGTTTTIGPYLQPRTIRVVPFVAACDVSMALADVAGAEVVPVPASVLTAQMVHNVSGILPRLFMGIGGINVANFLPRARAAERTVEAHVANMYIVDMAD